MAKWGLKEAALAGFSVSGEGLERPVREGRDGLKKSLEPRACVEIQKEARGRLGTISGSLRLRQVLSAG